MDEFDGPCSFELTKSFMSLALKKRVVLLRLAKSAGFREKSRFFVAKIQFEIK